MYKKSHFCLLFVLLAAFSLRAEPLENSYSTFQQIFNRWTDAFNQRDLINTCGLFDPSLVASFPAAENKNYSDLCADFKKLFQEKNKHYQYHFKLHKVYRSGDLAAARITWYLSVHQGNKKIFSSREEGLDIFKRQPNGKWQIINYIAYSKHKNY
jgi:ketosteroid isomerase-like protein